MPALASRGLNHQLYNAVEQRENKKISLVLLNSEENIKNASNFYDLINNVSAVEISEESKVCKLTYEQVKKFSSAIFESLDIFNYHLDYRINDFNAAPYLFISISDEMVEQSAVYWQCSWSDENNIQQVMWIDDMSGKMVGLMMNDNELSKASSDNTDENNDDYYDDIPKEIMILAEYCKENYRADDVVCYKDSGKRYVIEAFVNEDGIKRTYPLFVHYEKGQYLFFNI